MKLENYEMHLPSYSIGDKIYDKIGPVCESYGKTVMVIGGKRALAAEYEAVSAGGYGVWCWRRKSTGYGKVSVYRG